VALGFHPGQHHPDLAEVDLGYRAWRVLLRDEHFRQPACFQVDLWASSTDAVTDRRIRKLRRVVLLREAGEDSPRRVALLARGVEVLAEHLVDCRLERVSNRGGVRTRGFRAGGSA
jgi:hypothetical protein